MGRTSRGEVSSAAPKLEELTGIGRASAAALQAVDVASVVDLAACDPADLTARLTALYEHGGSKSRWALKADTWVASARAALGGPESRIDELSSFTVRFEANIEEARPIEISNYRCLVYDEHGAGEEVAFEIDPTQWAGFIFQRSRLPRKLITSVVGRADQHRDEEDAAVRATREDLPGGGSRLVLHAELDAPPGADVVVMIVSDDGLPTFAGLSAPDLSGSFSMPVPSLAPGNYRAFAWIKGTTPEGGYYRPVLGPLIRVHSGSGSVKQEPASVM